MEGAQAVASPADKTVSAHEERTSHEDDHYLSAGEDDDDKQDAASLPQSPLSTPPMSSVDDYKSAAAAILNVEDTTPSAEMLVKPSSDDHGESSLEDKASLAEVVSKPSEDESSRNEVSSKDDHKEPSPEIEPSKDDHKEPSPENEVPSKDDHKESSTNTELPSDKLVTPSENGDPVKREATFSSLPKSKSLNISESRVANAIADGEKDEKGDVKIVARPSADDDLSSPTVASPHHRRSVSVDLIAKVPANYNSSPSQRFSNVQIDTAAPIKSVKAAVSKFGGIVDWKAHRVHTVERRKFIEQELEKAQEELPACKQQCEAANEAKIQIQKQLESTKRLIEELKLNLERAQTEEQQAKQDSELAKLRVEEMEQGIADESSFAAKAQLEVAKARHAAAVSELKSVKDELEQLRTDYDLLIAEKQAAETKAEESIFSSKEIEKSVENLTIELITLKQSLDSAHSAHLEAEEHRIGAVMAKEQDNLNWEVELKHAEEELAKLNQQMITTKELKTKLDEATRLLQDLKGELAAYLESKPDQETSDDPSEKKTRADIEKAINASKRELQDVKNKIENATKEVNILKVASASLRSQLEKENTELQAIQQREGKASKAAASLEAEINRIKSEIVIIQLKEKEEREKLVDLPEQLQKAGQEAEQAKELTRIAREELDKAKHDADEAKAGANEREGKLRAVEKEIEAAKASERLALAALTALKESESAQNIDDSSFGITLSLEEYYELSKKGHEAEEQANARIAAAMSQVEIAKEAEKKSMEKLEEVNNEMFQRKETLEAALKKAAEAGERKLSAEQELKQWRDDHEQKQKNGDSAHSSTSTGKNSKDSKSQKSPKSSKDDGKGGKKKKKSFFPKFFMFLGKKGKSHSSKPEGS